MRAWCSASRATRRSHSCASGESLRRSKNIDMLGSNASTVPRRPRGQTPGADRVLEPDERPPFAWGEARGQPTTQGGVLD